MIQRSAHVLSLEIDDAAESDEESEPDSPANFPQARKQHVVPLFFSDAEIAVVTEEVRNLNVPWQDAAPSILETTDAGVLSVLLMSFTPNLYHFSISVDHRHPSLLLNLAKRLGDGGSRPLGLKRRGFNPSSASFNLVSAYWLRWMQPGGSYSVKATRCAQ
ncbi:hypothetical protein BDV35DRAFT_285490 [Aspergillus flavus]|uniref:Uncharacterized protein n=1 Tax=Aspergillus flavus TaxID=5059 RepID=A0A5N6GQE8_ASPFL|nr:hypothetical protein BDV35DRAFT_285490 [Aspergillus flavus]